jgi:hypothetical protein
MQLCSSILVLPIGFEEFPECIESFRPLQRMGTPDNIANVAEYLAGTGRPSSVGSIC